MRHYTQEEFEDEYRHIALMDIQQWEYVPDYRTICDCVSRWGSGLDEFRVYENCSNCLGKAFPPIDFRELK